MYHIVSDIYDSLNERLIISRSEHCQIVLKVSRIFLLPQLINRDTSIIFKYYIQLDFLSH